MNKPKAIIFDLDDTLILSDGTVERTWREACHAYSRAYPTVDPNRLFETIREVAEWYWSDSTRHREGRNQMDQTRRNLTEVAFQRMGLDHTRGAAELADQFSWRRSEVIELFPGVIETLNRVRQLGIKTGLLTNGESAMQRAKIERFQLDPYFDIIQIEGEKGFGKPEIRSYQSILSSLGVVAGEAWIVGDNLEWEVVVPQTIGLFAIWHNYYQKQIGDPGLKPDRIITEITQLGDLLVEFREN
jgi:putative hydrolase of the HAD superfamily